MLNTIAFSCEHINCASHLCVAQFYGHQFIVVEDNMLSIMAYATAWYHMASWK